MNIFHRLEPPAHEATREAGSQVIQGSAIFIRNAAEITNNTEQLMVKIVVVSRELFERRPIDPDGRLPGILELQLSVLSK